MIKRLFLRSDVEKLGYELSRGLKDEWDDYLKSDIAEQSFDKTMNNTK